MLAKTNVIHFSGSKLFRSSYMFLDALISAVSQQLMFNIHADNTALGTVCGKFFKVAMMSITDAGDSDILETKA